VFAVTDKGAQEGIGAFVVPTSTPGYIVARLEEKTGSMLRTPPRSCSKLQGPAANLLGEEGHGSHRPGQPRMGRINIAAQAVGMARAAWSAVAYAKERKTFGQALIEHQAVNFRLATARRRSRPPASFTSTRRPCATPAALPQGSVDGQALRFRDGRAGVLGRDPGARGYGYVADFPVERIWRDVRCARSTKARATSSAW